MLSNYPPGTSEGDPNAPWNQSMPPEAEDVIGMIVAYPDADDDTLIPDLGRITDYEEWEDAEGDEEGHVQRYGGINLIIEPLEGYSACGAREVVRPDDLDAYMIPNEGPLAEVVKLIEEQERLQEQVRTLGNRAANRLRLIGRDAVAARDAA